MLITVSPLITTVVACISKLVIHANCYKQASSQWDIYNQPHKYIMNNPIQLPHHYRARERGAFDSTRKFILTDLLAATAKPPTNTTYHSCRCPPRQNKILSYWLSRPQPLHGSALHRPGNCLPLQVEKERHPSAIVVDIRQYRHATHLHIQRCRGFRRHHY